MSLQSLLQKASDAYYTGVPFMTDDTFDKLAELCNFKEVGHKVQEGVHLPYRMYSLNKFYVGETESPLKKELLVETPKLDGAAVALIYLKGKLSVALTRGDGKTGRDISHLIEALPVPKSINSEEDLIQINGEIAAPKTIPNARNYASGALGLKDVEECKTRTLYFAAYGVQPYFTDSYSLDMLKLSEYGFSTVMNSDWSEFLQDGKVFRIDNNESFENLGYTAHHPRGAFALKERKEGIVTTLLDVVWQVGKSGVVTPIAILEPIQIDDAIVRKATLHNVSYIKALDLTIGCAVEVQRAGDIIPRVVRRVYQ